jgi:hypothetical protein
LWPSVCAKITYGGMQLSVPCKAFAIIDMCGAPPVYRHKSIPLLGSAMPRQ